MAATTIVKKAEGLLGEIESEIKNLTTKAGNQLQSTGLKGVKGLVDQASALEDLSNHIKNSVSAFHALMGDVTEEVTVPKRRGRVPKGMIPIEENASTESVAAPKRGRKPGSRTRQSSTRDESVEYTKGPEYEGFLLQGFKKLGGQAKFADAQKAMREVMESQGKLKEADLLKEGKPPRQRLAYLSGSRKPSLLKAGYIQEVGDSEFKLTAAGEEVVKKILAGDEHAIAPKQRGRKKAA